MDKALKKNILKGSAATSIGTVSGMIFQFLTIMLMTRFVTKDDFGIYVLVIVIVNMFNLLGGLGLELTMVKFIASDNKDENQNVLMPILFLRSIGLIFFGLVLIFASRYILNYFDPRISEYIYYIVIIFILANFRDLFYNLMQGLNQFKHYSIVNVTSSVFRVILVFLALLFSKLDLKSLLIIEILSTLQPLVHQISYNSFKKLTSIKPTINSFKRIIKFSIPLYLNNLVVFVNGRVNIFIIGAYLSPVSIANFDVATKVPDALKKIFQSFIIVYFPNLAKLFSQGDKDSALKLIEKSISVFSIIVTYIIIFTFLFRNELTLLLFSEKYVEVSLAFAILIFTFLIKGLSDLMGYPFVPAGYPSVPPKINTISSIISISLSLILVPIYGYMGAVYALLTMNLTSAVQFYYFLSKYNIKPHLFSSLKPAILILLAPISLLFSGQFHIYIDIFLFIISLILSWYLVSDVRDFTKFLMIQIRKLFLEKKSV